MKRSVKFYTLLFFALSLSASIWAQTSAGNETSGEEQIQRALQKASQKNCLVLMKFSADWCPWCVDMKKIFREKSMVDALKGFELAEFDVGERTVVAGKKQYARHFDLMKKYAEKIFIPQLIILDSSGKIVARLNPDDYEDPKSKGNDPSRLSKILLKYK